MAAVAQGRSCSDKEEQEKVGSPRVLQSSAVAHWLPCLWYDFTEKPAHFKYKVYAGI